MFVLGHSGIGSALARRLTEPAAWRWLVAGTLLPDLVDKPLYYGLVLVTGRRGAELGLVSGTRTFGHTALAILAVLAIGLAARRRPAAVALALGMATHLLLDELGDFVGGVRLPAGARPGPPTIAAILFPLLGARFPVMPFRDAAEHAGSIASPWVLGGEVVGGAIWLGRLVRRRRRPRT